MGATAVKSVLAPPRPTVLGLLQVALLALLVFACVRIVVPFTALLLWSVVLAVLLYPLHRRLSTRLGNRGSAVLIGVAGVALVLAPMVMIATSLASSLSALVAGVQNNTLSLPQPPARLADVPLVGQKLTDAWALAASSLPAAVAKYAPTLRGPLAGLAAAVGRLAAAELSFVLSFAIAALLVAYGTACAEFARRLLHLVTGRGARMVALTASTIRGVALGVVGVATIQAVLLGAGFFAIGLPGAGLLTIVVLLLGVVQVPATLLTLPIIAYVIGTEAIGPAIIFSAWTLVAGLSDNILKPFMLGRGMDVPMPIILIGVIGGMVADGLLGLFVGPVLLAIGYVLFMEWLRQQPNGELEGDGPTPP